MMDKISQQGLTSNTNATIIIPRPKSVTTKRDSARVDDSYQSWMQEYHRQHHHHRNQQLLKAAGAPASSPQLQPSPDTMSKSSGSPSNSISKKSKGSNLFLSFNSLKLNPNDNFNTLRKNALGSPMMDGGKIEQLPETLEGYRIYKGAGTLNLGLSRQNTISTVADYNDEFHKVPETANGTMFSPYTPLILPDKFIIAQSKAYGPGKSSVRLSSQQMAKQMTPPFHVQIHPQRRPRPHSASIDFSTHHYSPTKDKNGNKVKENTRSPKSVPQTPYKAPTITTIQLHSSDAIALTPRSIPTPSPTKTQTMDENNNTVTKLEHQNVQPKSILKNHKDCTTLTPQTIQLGIANYSKTLPLSHQKVKHEFAYHELIVSPNKNQNVTPVALPRHRNSQNHQKSPSHQSPSSPTGTESRRPKSASATLSKYELIEKSPPARRKSVTFNSYVSFSSDSRVSTIRALPVDV